MIAQPLTQLLRIRQENRVAAAEAATSRDDLKNAENEVALQVHSLYYAILVVQLQKKPRSSKPPSLPKASVRMKTRSATGALFKSQHCKVAPNSFRDSNPSSPPNSRSTITPAK